MITRIFEVQGHEGQQVSMGLTVPSVQPTGEWACAVQISAGNETPQHSVAYGEDPLQAADRAGVWESGQATVVAGRRGARRGVPESTDGGWGDSLAGAIHGRGKGYGGSDRARLEDPGRADLPRAGPQRRAGVGGYLAGSSGGRSQ